jgi:hypothetical protein
MATLLTLGQPATAFQFVYMIYLYTLPILLWAAFAWLVIDDQSTRAGSGAPAQPLRLLAALLIPLLGAVFVLLLTPSTRRSYGLSIFIGLLSFLAPLAVGLWLAGGPLGPKALG